MEKLQTASEVKACITYLKDDGLSTRWTGTCLWIETEPTPAQEVDLVRTLGARWSNKRGKWYLRADESIQSEYPGEWKRRCKA